MGPEEFIAAVAAGLIAIVGWEFWQWYQRLRTLDKQFGHLAGEYEVTRKLKPDTQEPGIAVVKVEGDILRVSFRDLPEGETVAGEISMNEHLPRSGRGHYEQITPEMRRWGFWDVQVVPGALLVHTTYAHHEEHYAVVSGFVWTRR